MSKETRALQDDDATGPAVLWLLDGEALWKRKVGDKACADCHQDMKGVAARYPAFDKKLMNLEQRINQCRTDQQKAPAFAYESRELLSLSAYIGRQSRGMPIAISNPSKQHLESGRNLFVRKQGQLNLSCAQCHDERWGKSLAGNPIPQAHPTGYPIYRLEWQNLGSLQRRLRNCMIGVRAEPYAYGSQEFVELEYYLMWRARGMKLETPAVRP
jgi:sulfur-oxidizing protein SoxA